MPLGWKLNIAEPQFPYGTDTTSDRGVVQVVKVVIDNVYSILTVCVHFANHFYLNALSL